MNQSPWRHECVLILGRNLNCTSVTKKNGKNYEDQFLDMTHLQQQLNGAMFKNQFLQIRIRIGQIYTILFDFMDNLFRLEYIFYTF